MADVNNRIDAAGPASAPPPPIRNALTVDVEDYFQVSAFERLIPRSSWDSLPSRIELNIDRILAMMADHSIHATFFTLGWIAQRHPQIVRRIVASGHELASHGYAHVRATDQSRTAFAEDVGTAKKLLEDISGVRVSGYRAPSFSIGSANLWALDCLVDAGYVYSSSIYPIRHDHYGMPEAPRFPYAAASANTLLEIPVTTIRLASRNLPAGGGGYFRLLPYAVSKACLQRVNRADGKACVFYFHPWEIDPDQPRQRGISLKTRFRHYVNLSNMQFRLVRLMRDFAWDRMDRIFLKTAS